MKHREHTPHDVHYVGQGARWFVIYTLAVLLGCLALAMCDSAHAQEAVEAEATVNWTLPTTDTLGQPLEGDRALRRVLLYVSTSPIVDAASITPIDLGPGDTTYVYERSVPNGSTLYFRVAACNAICSGLSEDTPESRKEIRVSVPNVPTGVTVTLRVNLEVLQQ